MEGPEVERLRGELDRLCELANVGAGHAAGALARLIGCTVWMDPPRVRIAPRGKPDPATGVLGLETSGAVTQGLVDLDVQGLPADSLDTYRERVTRTSLEDLQRQARERLHPERAAIVVVGPAEALVPALEGLGPVRVVQP